MSVDFTGLDAQVSKWLALGLGLVAAALGIRLRWSGDRLTMRKHDGEGGWISQVQRERDESIVRERATMAAHIKVLEENAGLRLQHAFAEERLERLERELRKIKSLLIEERPDLAGVLNTGFTELNVNRTKDT